ncbi:MAG: Permease of the drug/metabolite transporter (DMT) superfamily [Ktedonobacterales bacterium]|jgi:drug/metabolite transporter (DMT)-like permease|nr:MAG: Permease of the drug/metabolite transporter (DMT) superfamily [Ktedonobacterales bacterium]
MAIRQKMSESRGIQVAAALLAVYIIWGSTYLAIRFAIETLPPLLMAGVRFLLAGILLYGWVRLRGGARPKLLHWRTAAVLGGLLLVGGNGGVVWAEQFVPSGLTALLVSMAPIWMALLDWLRPGGQRPRVMVAVGLALGLGGVALLVAAGSTQSSGPLQIGGLLLVVAASFSWALGSLYAQHAPSPTSPLLGTAMEMLAGGALLMVIALATGELGQLHPDAISVRSLAALGYLVIFGSLVGFSCYVWLLRNTALSLASTYAYVNPMVAVFLGWALAGEQLSPLTFVAAAIILASVVLITTFRAARPTTTTAETIETAEATRATRIPEMVEEAETATQV